MSASPPSNTVVERDRALEIGGRLAAPPAASMVESAFAEELECQADLFAAMGLADLAYTIALAEAGIVPRPQAAALLGELLALQSRPADFVPDSALGDLYTNREAWLRGRTGSVGWLGFGRARREATTTAFHAVAKARLLELVTGLISAAEAILRSAADHGSVLFPSYTYLQVAQPTTFGHYLSSFAYPLIRDLERARELFARLDRCPAGCGSGDGSTLPLDRRNLAGLLGFGDVVPHARDAMWQVDGPVECLSVAVAAALNLDRLAEDLMVFSSREFGFLELSDAHCRASKLMPQKKNPFALSWLRGLANRLIGVQAAMAASGRTPTGQVDNRLQAYIEVPRALAATARATRLVADVVDGLTLRPARARKALDDGFALATDLVEVLVLEVGIDVRSARQIVGRLASDLADAGRPASDLRPSDVEAVAEATLGRALVLTPEGLARALDPAAAVARRKTLGGAAPERLAEALGACQVSLAEWSAWHRNRADAAADAEQRLLERAREIAGGG